MKSFLDFVNEKEIMIKVELDVVETETSVDSDDVEDNILTIMNSLEFKQWISNLTEEEIKNIEIGAADFYKSEPQNAEYLRKCFFVEKFLEQQSNEDKTI
jgi:hypothetical protein